MKNFYPYLPLDLIKAVLNQHQKIIYSVKDYENQSMRFLFRG